MKKLLLSTKYLFCLPVLCSGLGNLMFVLPIPRIELGPPSYVKTLPLFNIKPSNLSEAFVDIN